MKFVVAKDDLSYLIGKLQNVVSQRPTTPILANIMLRAKGGMLQLTATDLTVGMRCEAEAKIQEEGAITVPAKPFFQLMKLLTAANVEVSSQDQDLITIEADSSRFRLNGMNHQSYPALPDVSEATQFRIAQKALRDVLFRTAFAVSKEENRYTLMGLLFELSNSMLTVVGTDGKRLAQARAEVDLDPSVEGSYIVPIKAVDEILKMSTEDEDQEVTVHLMADKIAVISENTMVISKLLSGDFPDYKRVIPGKGDLETHLHREELMTLLRQISLFAADASHSVRFTFTPGELTLNANTMDVGEGKVSMPVNYSGPKFSIAFNPGFSLDILRHCTGETVLLELTDPYNPGKVVDTENQNALYVIMPMRLNEG